MSKFPKPVELPSDIYVARATREKLIINSAKLGITFRIFIAFMEFTGSLFTQSSTLYTDALSNLSDISSTLFLILFVKLARRPPDKDHPFGHGRYEPFGGLLLGLFITLLGTALFLQQIFLFPTERVHHEIHPSTWVIPLIAIILLEISYKLLMKTAKNEHSPALIAEAFHYRVDSITTVIALFTLMIASAIPSWGGVIDHMGAILIALFMIFLGLFSLKENFYQLTDKIPDESLFNRVRKAAKKVQGVKETEKILIQTYGPDAHVNIDIEVSPMMSVEEAHEISQKVRAEIQKDWPSVRDVSVHIEPYYANDH